MLKLVPALALAAVGAAPATLVGRVSSELNDYNPSFDGSERRMVFARSKADFAQAVIMISERRGGSWSRPRSIEFSDPRFSDSDPWLTPDGRTLYFVSNRPSAARPNKTDLDIWRSRWSRSGWSAPEHLGEDVNGPGPELGPEFRSGVLTFSTVRQGGKGGLDIYQSHLGPKGFEAPVPLAGPFNSAESDSDFTVSPDGRLAAFWRGRNGGRIFLSRRLGGRWTAPAPLSSANIGPFNFTPAFSRGRLWFASTRKRPNQQEGMADIYVASLPTIPK